MSDASKPWYKFGEIRFTTDQVWWMLENWHAFEANRWPTDPHSQVDAMPGRVGFGHRAGFENALLVRAELARRLARCRQQDVTLTMLHLADSQPLEELAVLLNTSIYRLKRRVWRVVRYVSGWRPRAITYEEFCQHRKPYRKTAFCGTGKGPLDRN